MKSARTPLATFACSVMLTGLAQAANVSAPLPDGGTISVDASKVVVDSFGAKPATATTVPGGVAVQFDDPDGGVPGVFRFASNSWFVGELPMKLSIPLTVTPGSVAPELQVSVNGDSWISVMGSTAWKLDFQYQLTVDGVDSLGTKVNVISQTGTFSTNTLGRTTALPLTASGLVSSDFSLSGLEVKVRVSAINPPWPSNNVAPFGGIDYAVARTNISSITVTAVPEPGTWALGVMGLGALIALRQHQRRRNDG